MAAEEAVTPAAEEAMVFKMTKITEVIFVILEVCAAGRPKILRKHPRIVLCCRGADVLCCQDKEI